MPSRNVNVKWGKEKFNVCVNTDDPPLVFKAQLFALTGVQPERQKVMVKASTVKDDSWGNIDVKDGMLFMLMGTGAEIPIAPEEKRVFVEDLSEQQLASVLESPCGLRNLGNTCYMNATIQCLRSVPELCNSLVQANVPNAISAEAGIMSALKDLFGQMNKTSNAISPIFMLSMLHNTFPQFAERSEEGGLKQQDADEFWGEIMRCLQKTLQPLSVIPHHVSTSSRSFIDQFFGIEFQGMLKCLETENEAPTYTTESHYKLSCFIEKDVKYLLTGLRNKLEETVTKYSPTLERDAQYKKVSKISRLPGYLTVQMVRFQFKNREGINAKILKEVKFPQILDVFELCTDELQKMLIPVRAQIKEIEDSEAHAVDKAKTNISKTENQTTPFLSLNDVGSNNSGYYELRAVLTHKGRSSSGGHYVAWVQTKNNEWTKFDDDNTYPILIDDVLKLAGGGDWHCAYILLYGPRKLVYSESNSDSVAA